MARALRLGGQQTRGLGQPRPGAEIVIDEALGTPQGRSDGGARIRRNRPVTGQHEAGVKVRHALQGLDSGPRREGTVERAIQPPGGRRFCF
jgi:hypothetical protein